MKWNKPKFHRGPDDKPTTPPEVSSQSRRVTVTVSRKKALAAPALSATAKAPVVIYFCAACASIFSITMALEPPRL